MSKKGMAREAGKSLRAADLPPKTSSDFVLPTKANSAIRIVAPSGSPDKKNANSASRLKSKPSSNNGTGSPSPGPSLFIPPQKLGKPKYLDGASVSQAEQSRNGRPTLEAATEATADLQDQDQDQLDANDTSSVRSKAQDSSLDIYANNYTPMWLTAINDAAATVRLCYPLSTIDYATYIASFTGYRFSSSAHQPTLPPIRPVLRRISTRPEDLHPQIYGEHFSEGLQNEIGAEFEGLKGLSMYNTPYNVEDPSRQLYRFNVPGLRENSPRVDLGDVVKVRPINATSPLPWTGDMSLQPAGVFSGWEFHAITSGVSKSKEQVLLRMDGFIPGLLRTCNIIFTVQEHRCTPIFRSIEIAADLLNSLHGSPSPWLRSMLFPDERDARLQTRLSRGAFDLQWCDKKLNFEQMKAVDAVVRAEYGCVPYLISGPAGTGKTKTIVETVMQLLRSNTIGVAPHLLVCAPSDPAADTLALRLSAYLSPRELFRLNGWTRSFAEVSEKLLPYTFAEHDLFSLPEFKTLMSFTVVVTTCRDADMLVQARLTNEGLTNLRKSVMTGAKALDDIQLLHWTALLLDEAAQATEPEALIPINVINPLSSGENVPSRPHQVSGNFIHVPQIIMAGDEHQLGPCLFHKSEAEMEHLKGEPAEGKLPSVLSTSLFARLFARPLYNAHPLSRSKGSKPLTSAILPILRPAFTNLVRNYRSHPAILTVPSVLFYDDTLIPESMTLSDVIGTWPGWQSRTTGGGKPPAASSAPSHWPVLFCQNSSPDALESILVGNSTGALFNAGEAKIALNIVQSLLRHAAYAEGAEQRIAPKEIAVMSPFRAQVNHLRKTFREAGLYEVNIGPLEAYQGLESRVVVLCTTRTRLGARNRSLLPKLPANPSTTLERFSRQQQQDHTSAQEQDRFVAEDQAQGLGIIGHPKRFNVAVTRAKEGLFVIGDITALICTNDHAWTAFLAFCERNGRIVHAHTWENMVGNKSHHATSKRPSHDSMASAEHETMAKTKQRGVSGQVKQGRLERALRYAAEAREREMVKQDSEKKRADSDRGFGYPEKGRASTKRGGLRGNMTSLDEDMWNLGLKAAEEANEDDEDDEVYLAGYGYEGELAGEVDKHGNDQDEDVGNDIQQANKENLCGDIAAQSLGHSSTALQLQNLCSGSFKRTSQTPNGASSITLGRSSDGMHMESEFDHDPEAEFEKAHCATQ